MGDSGVTVVEDGGVGCLRVVGYADVGDERGVVGGASVGV